MKSSLRTMRLAACSAALLGTGLAILFFRSSAPPPEAVLREVRREIASGRYEKAAVLVHGVLSRSPRHPDALLTAAELAVKQRDLKSALEFYRQIPDDGSPTSVAGLFGMGEILCHQGRLSESERQLRRALAHNPDHGLSHFRLAYILDITGRRWEAIEHLLELVRHDRFSVENLLTLGDFERVVQQPELLDLCRAVAPDDPLPQLGLARVAMARNENREAVELIHRVLAKIPNEIEAQIRLGTCLYECGQFEEFIGWHEGLLPEADQHPDTWVVRGSFAQDHDNLAVAARCFWEAVKREPNHRMANYHLGRTLMALDVPDQAAPFLARSDQLLHLTRALEVVFQNRRDTAAMRDVVELMEWLERDWEAWAWSRLALAEDPRLDWPRETIARIEPRLHRQLPRTNVARNPVWLVDLSAYPLADWKAFRNRAASGKASVRAQVSLRFSDVADEAGIHFVYFSRPNPDQPGALSFEGTGGGVAAIDFDGDFWPDLYFTQGCRWPPRENQNEHRDRLFRNLGDGRAMDVTEAAGLGDERYSQGIAAGDFNNDGFPDLYVANIGRNRLYRNNGDGTFADVGDKAGIGGDAWTTSCMIADLNGDSWPDIYDVNYCAGDKVFSLLCEKQGLLRSCSPLAFDAAPDRIFISRGDGTFEDVSASSGIDVPGGYGLGIVAADFEGAGRLNLFVANDETPNFYFVNDTSRRGGPLKFAERGLVSGLALNADGLAQGCMGVAAGDADGDGLCDVLVTNFFQESSTLYLQQPGGLFIDSTRRSGLRDPTFNKLGFGAQFLDADLDGRLDLVVTNGHIDDMRELGAPFKMPPQFFHNLGDGKFMETTAGEFFEGTYLGRGLARLDWNRDGKEDFAVSHIGSPAALVVNRTDATGHFLALRFRGVTCDRDAIGTRVQLTAGGRTWTSQLTAGDGYHATNERRLVLGLGEVTSIDKLVVRWLSGTEQTFSAVAADKDLLLIEGRNELIPIPRVPLPR